MDSVECLIFREDIKTKTNQGGLDCREIQPRTTYVYRNPNTARCPVHLYQKYCSLLSVVNECTKPDLYVQPVHNPTLDQWYSDRLIGINTLHTTMKCMAANTGLTGKFSNHSLRGTSATCLYESGCPEKLIKEVMGNRSNTVHEYQCTSNNLKRAVSTVLGRAPGPQESKQPKVEINCANNAQASCEKASSLTQCIQSTTRNAITSHVDGKCIKKLSVQVNFEFDEN